MSEGILSATIPITLDGRDLQLRYRAHAFILYAEQLDRDLLIDMQEIGEAFRNLAQGKPALGAMLGRLRDVLWAGLAEVQPDITRDALARMFDLRDIGIIAPAMTEALRRSLPEPERPTIAVQPESGSRRINGADTGQSAGTPAESPLESFAL